MASTNAGNGGEPTDAVYYFLRFTRFVTSGSGMESQSRGSSPRFCLRNGATPQIRSIWSLGKPGFVSSQLQWVRLFEFIHFKCYTFIRDTSIHEKN